MRGFFKAAALLFAAPSLSFVIPDSASLAIPPSNAVLEYHPRDASVRFDITPVETSERYPIFTFQVRGISKACGGSSVLLNGLKLDSEWDGTTANGHGYLDIYGGKEAQWHISCLYNAIPTDGANSQGADVVHVLSLVLGSSADQSQPGFTISYKQLASPAILRFEPRHYPLSVVDSPEFGNRWRTPSLDFDPDVLEIAQKHGHHATFGFLSQGQKSLGTYLKTLKGSLTNGVNKAIEHLCPKHGAKSKIEAIAVSPDRLLEPAPISTDETDFERISKTEVSESTNTIPSFSAAETRSLNHLEISGPSLTPQSTTSLPFQSYQQAHIVKLFGLVLILGSLFAWVCLRCRDPRRRAECLALREERRNKKLYRRAARQHKVKMWFWNIRLKFGLAPNEILSWDEKSTRVIQQENVLGRIMTDDIRALRNAHRVVSTITAAEEGRNSFAYDIEGSDRRRSCSTLPGYESEGSQPPHYDDFSGRLEGTAAIDGFQYTTETEFRSDSSVISTSPRISRDGTNSDFDEKFEPISLEAAEPAGPGP